MLKVNVVLQTLYLHGNKRIGKAGIHALKVGSLDLSCVPVSSLSDINRTFTGSGSCQQNAEKLCWSRWS
jgi:hypothetical protein